MLRRRAYQPASSANLLQQRGFMGGMFGGKKKETAAAGADGGKNNGGGFPNMPGFDSKRMKEFMGKSPEEQVKFMRDALEMQKKVGGSVPGLGKFNNMNVKMMEQMVSGLEKTMGKSDTAPTSSTAATTTSAAPTTSTTGSSWKAPNSTNNGNSASSASRTASPFKSAQPVANEPPAPNAFKNASGPTLDELRKINLGPEIEELFSELKLMRGKRDHYRSEMDKSEVALKFTASELKETQDKVANLRKRLGSSEQTVTKLTAENIALQQKAAELQQVQSQVRTLNTTVSALKGNDTAPLAEKIASLEKALAASTDARKSLQRKLDRARRKDPVLQFSLQILTELASRKAAITHAWNHRSHTTASTAVSSSGQQQSSLPSAADVDANDSFLMSQSLESIQFGSGNTMQSAADILSSSNEEIFSALQDAFTKSTDSVWATSCGPQSAKALVLASSDYVATRIGRPLVSLDAVVTLGKGYTTLPDGITSSLEALGFIIEPATTNDPSSTADGRVLVVKAVGALTAQNGFMGPYGICKLLTDAIKYATSSATATTDSTAIAIQSLLVGGGGASITATQIRSLAETVISVTPTITASLANDTRRAHVDIHTSRSAGPGGQAANVGETQITANLIIDGLHLVTSECQDSRSAMSNKDVALKRLYGEKLDKFNRQTLGKVRVADLFVPPHLSSSSSSVTADSEVDGGKSGVTTASQWESLCGAAEAHLVKEGKLVELCLSMAAKDALATPASASE